MSTQRRKFGKTPEQAMDKIKGKLDAIGVKEDIYTNPNKLKTFLLAQSNENTTKEILSLLYANTKAKGAVSYAKDKSPHIISNVKRAEPEFDGDAYTRSPQAVRADG